MEKVPQAERLEYIRQRAELDAQITHISELIAQELWVSWRAPFVKCWDKALLSQDLETLQQQRAKLSSLLHVIYNHKSADDTE